MVERWFNRLNLFQCIEFLDTRSKVFPTLVLCWGINQFICCYIEYTKYNNTRKSSLKLEVSAILTTNSPPKCLMKSITTLVIHSINFILWKFNLLMTLYLAQTFWKFIDRDNNVINFNPQGNIFLISNSKLYKTGNRPLVL